ncbi:hypothetical protein [Methylobacterium sp. NEAU K]|uniref:hypothetical protein n=1 Tax=Methylobacterium sp. NEAU K TaxID=3064946 RepID=UPI002734EB88|nr:hypothetical protein [Methylobacterium sp. NEAU K]MDP4006921.1 hypothetical protein [Methylobacterium sp. NEAU K]
MRAADHCTLRVQRSVPQGGAQFTHDIPAVSRTEVETLIKGLIDLLDAFDRDADLEPEVLDASAAEWAGCGAHRFNVGRAA